MRHAVDEGDAVAADGVIGAAQQRHHVGFDLPRHAHAVGRQITESAGEPRFQHYLQHVLFNAEPLRGRGVGHRHALEAAQIWVVNPGPGRADERAGEERSQRFEQTRPQFRVGQTPQQRIDPAFVKLAGEKVAGYRRRRRVRVRFQRHIDAVRLGGVDLGHQLRNLAGVVGMRAVVRDMHRDAGAPSDFQRFGDAAAAGRAIVVMVAHVNDVDAAKCRDDLVQRD